MRERMRIVNVAEAHILARGAGCELIQVSLSEQHRARYRAYLAPEPTVR